MKPLRLSSLLVIATMLFIGCGDDENEFNLGGGTGGKQPGTQVSSSDIEVPQPRSDHGSFVITHTALLNSKTNESGVNYRVEWDPVIRAQRWCAYKMYGKVVGGVMRGTNAENTTRYTSKTNQYPNDPDIDSKYHFTSDPYWNTGFDHGHICPSADRLGSYQANYQTFFLTNMMPQTNKFNRGVWSAMESKVRDWAKKYDTLYVCKGGTIDKEAYILKYLGSGNNTIPVPKYFFMAILGKNSMGYTGLGFWIEHSSSIPASDDLNKYMLNIRTLEEKTGINFFYNLPDDVENWVETLPVSTLKTTWVIK
jgi:endonuclease G